MSTPYLDILKIWWTGTTVIESDWDNIRTPLVAWSDDVVLDIQQLRIDILGATYSLDEDGLANLANPMRQWDTGVSALAWTFTNTVGIAGALTVSNTANLTASTLSLPKNFTVDQTTADYTVLFSNPAAARNITFTDPLGHDSVAYLNAVQSLANKTLVSPVITTSPTATGSTWADLGSVTTADINGGTIDATTIGATTPAEGTFTNLTITGNVPSLINWIQATQVGNELAIATVGAPALTALNGTDVAFIDSINDKLRTYRFNGTDWAQVGNDLAIATVNTSALTALNGTDVAFIDSTNNKLRTYRFNGTDWAQVGNELAIAGVGVPALTALNGTDVAFIDSTNDKLRTYRFNGTDWAQVGNELAIAGVGAPALTALNGTDVAFIDSINDKLRTYRFNGTDWAQVGNELAIAGVSVALALTALNGTDVAFIDENNDKLRTYRFNGTDWAQVGNELAIATVNTPALTALNGTDVAFIDSTNDKLRTYRFSFSLLSPYSVSGGAF